MSRMCRRHPDCTVPKGQQGCFLCGDASPHVESDRLKFERLMHANNIEPGQGHRYTTPGAYQRLLKRHGLTDDVSPKELRNRVTDRSYRERVQNQKIERVLEGMRDPAMRAAQEGRPVQTERQQALRRRLEQVLKR